MQVELRKGVFPVLFLRIKIMQYSHLDRENGEQYHGTNGESDAQSKPEVLAVFRSSLGWTREIGASQNFWREVLLIRLQAVVRRHLSPNPDISWRPAWFLVQLHATMPDRAR